MTNSDPNEQDAHHTHQRGPKDGLTEPRPRSATQTLASMLESPDNLHHADDTDDIVSEADAEFHRLCWPVILPAMAIVIAVVVWGLASPLTFSDFASDTLAVVVNNFGWAFALFGTVFVAFIVVLAATKFGHIKLGRDNEAPEFSTVSWVAMMFAAGMGIGLMFYGTSEPLGHYRAGVPGHEEQEVGTAFATTLFHWTLHPWSVYAIVGLGIAYSTFRVGRKQLLSSAFTPLIGVKGAEGVLGKIIDILAIIATVFGTAASLGIGAVQISAGLDKTGLVPDASDNTILMIVLVLTLAFVISAMSGVGKGIQYISNVNMILAGLLAVFVFILGPTVHILNMIPTAAGNYLLEFFEMAARTADSANGTAGGWLAGWTIFYWAWWISWSPFVGMFLARISRGRTIREFVIGVIAVPTAVSVVWFCIFGGTAIHLEQIEQSIYGDGDAKRQLFDLLYTLPGGSIAAFLAMLLLATFFITSADSASTVMGSMSQNGRLEANRFVTAGWGVGTAAIGLTLLMTGGEDVLSNLQNVTIIVASPFLLVIFLLMFAIVKDLRNDQLYLDHKAQREFAMNLAREARIHAEHQKREAKKAAKAAKAPKSRVVSKSVKKVTGK
ncbi:BCCT family transporter [Corynebacterium sp. CCM 8864]|uniref:BCCT family transporter n=1 Tax=Corynebacterium marambiense TaxID=2765364 RepID=A0ABS0VUF1_9CORY|nr:BCCT family transporter [Corynebacterium marambiense]MBI8999991.1 BCCT family transporter [Corynebacterium marambiense]